MDDLEKENGHDGRVCPQCKCVLNADAKFCANCGARCEDAAPEKRDVDPFDYPPDTPYEQMEKQSSQSKKFCGKCGSPLDGGAFCGKCGAPTGVATGKTNARKTVTVDEPEDPPTEQEQRLRKRSGIFAAAGAVVALLGILFAIAPFLGFSYGEYRTVKPGLVTVWTMFGGAHELAETGVSYEVLRFTGWAYVVFVLAAIAFGVCGVIYSTGKKDVHPLLLLPSAGVLLAAGIMLSVLDIIACAQIKTEHGALFMGGVGMFVFALAAFALALAAALYSTKTYKKRKGKKLSGRAIACIVVACVAVVFSAYAVRTPATLGAGTDFPLWEDSSGFAYVDISERVGDYRLGMTVIRLRELEAGETYRFSVTFGSIISADDLEDCLGVYSDAAVGDATAYDVMTSGRPLEVNQSSGMSRASVTFTYSGDDDLAVVVLLAATSRTSVRFTYEFEKN